MITSSLREELVTKAKEIKILPSLHSVVDKVFHVMGDKNSSFEQLANVIKYDQSMSSKVISIANSAYYNRGIEVVTLQRAMLVIGFEEIKRIVTCLVFVDGILKSMKLKHQDFTSLWRHSLYVALSAKALSAKSLREDPEKTFAAALLHDIGKIILYMKDIGYRDVINSTNGKDTCAREKELFGVDHQEIGYFLATKWRLPEEFIQVIRGHHNTKDDANVLLSFAATADLFALRSNSDLGAEGIILRREDEGIKAEIERIMNVLGLADEKA